MIRDYAMRVKVLVRATANTALVVKLFSSDTSQATMEAISSIYAPVKPGDSWFNNFR